MLRACEPTSPPAVTKSCSSDHDAIGSPSAQSHGAAPPTAAVVTKTTGRRSTCRAERDHSVPKRVVGADEDAARRKRRLRICVECEQLVNGERPKPEAPQPAHVPLEDVAARGRSDAVPASARPQSGGSRGRRTSSASADATRGASRRYERRSRTRRRPRPALAGGSAAVVSRGWRGGRAGGRPAVWNQEPSCSSGRSDGSARMSATDEAPRARQRRRSAAFPLGRFGSPQTSSPPARRTRTAIASGVAAPSGSPSDTSRSVAGSPETAATTGGWTPWRPMDHDSGHAAAEDRIAPLMTRFLAPPPVREAERGGADVLGRDRRLPGRGRDRRRTRLSAAPDASAARGDRLRRRFDRRPWTTALAPYRGEIVFIRKENGGEASAKNAAAARASGRLHRDPRRR